MSCVRTPTIVNSKALECEYFWSTWKALTCFNAASVHMVSSPFAWCHRALRPHTSPPQAADWTTWFFKAMRNFMSTEVTMHISILSSLRRKHTPPSSQPNAISLPSYSCRPLYTKIYNKSLNWETEKFTWFRSFPTMSNNVFVSLLVLASSWVSSNPFWEISSILESSPSIDSNVDTSTVSSVLREVDLILRFSTPSNSFVRVIKSICFPSESSRTLLSARAACRHNLTHLIMMWRTLWHLSDRLQT